MQERKRSAAPNRAQERSHLGQHSQLQPWFRQLSPLQIAELYCPQGSVPALIRHRGRLIAHHCPTNIALGLVTESSA